MACIHSSLNDVTLQDPQMGADQIMPNLLQSAAVAYKTSLHYFQPWGNISRKNNIIAERNISFHIARAFTNSMAHGIAFMERPFCTEGINNTLFLDSYCFAPELAVLLEVKKFFDFPTEIDRVLKDLGRVSCGHANQHQKWHPQINPLDTRGLVVVECWKPPIIDWWMDPASPKSINAFPPTTQPIVKAKTGTIIQYVKNGWTFGKIYIGKFPVRINKRGRVYESCYWLYCYTPICNSNHPIAIPSSLPTIDSATSPG